MGDIYNLNIKVVGGKEEISEFLLLLAKMETLGDVGANRTIPVAYDGDGSGNLKFEALDGQINMIGQLKDSIQKGKKLNMDDENFLTQIDNKIETHYIGE